MHRLGGLAVGHARQAVGDDALRGHRYRERGSGRGAAAAARGTLLAGYRGACEALLSWLRGAPVKSAPHRATTKRAKPERTVAGSAKASWNRSNVQPPSRVSRSDMVDGTGGASCWAACRCCGWGLAHRCGVGWSAARGKQRCRATRCPHQPRRQAGESPASRRPPHVCARGPARALASQPPVIDQGRGCHILQSDAE